MDLRAPSFSAACRLISLLHVFLLLGCTKAVNQPGTENKTLLFPAVFGFGDSIVDQGNNNHLTTQIKCNFPPYGKDFMGGLPTGRFSNAKTLLDILAGELGIKEFVPAYLNPNLRNIDLITGVSFASGASGYDPLTPKLRSVLSLSDQLDMFRDYTGKLNGAVGEERANNIINKSLILVVAGSVDFCHSYYTTGVRRSQYDVSSYCNLLAASATNFIQEIYKLGARKIAVFGLPPVGCVPFMRTHDGGLLRLCAEHQNQAAQLFNTKLSSELDTLTKILPESKVVYIDIYNPLLDIIQNPQLYGIEVVDRGCCGTGKLEVALLCNQLSQTCLDDSKYLFWDSFHPTEKGYRTLIDHILQTNIHSFF
ncbi:GDSL esterase/lipase EXL3 [Heracleum sosnowskyi]|uniref:GDSL esterase/lipase EXL3 n=1 Tax=Heracleum sosnowskyi TaxID=360622 RepID=A0AAD8IPG1_9APIA|nr:GDSL esterase/lipase EXL3 [Heracleum sosnowskyi]